MSGILDLPDSVLEGILCRAARAYKRRATWMLLAVCRRFRACLMARATRVSIANDDFPPLEHATHLRELRLLSCTRLPPSMTPQRRFAHLTKLEILQGEYSTDVAFAGVCSLPALEHLKLSLLTGVESVARLLTDLATHTALKHLILEETTTGGDDEEEDFPYLAKLTSLHTLAYIGHTHYCAQGCDLLTSLHALTKLSLDNTHAGTHTLRDLNLLRALGVSGCYAIEGDELDNLTALTNLEHLNLAFCYRLTDGLSHLTALSVLTYLNLAETNAEVDDEGVSHIAKITSLKHLVLEGSGTSHGLSQLSSLASLENLCMEFYIEEDDDGATEQGAELAWLASLSSLTALDLVHDLSGGDAAALATLPSLKHLDAAIGSADAFGHLAKMTPLTRLRISSGRADVRIVQAMSQLSSLTGLNELKLPACVDDVLASFVSLTGLQRLCISAACEIGGKGLATLPALAHLTRLDLTDSDVSDEDLSLLALPSSLCELALTSFARVTDAGLQCFSRLQSLQALDLNDFPGVQGTCLARLGSATALARLFLTHCPALNDEGLLQLSKLTGLEHLHVERCGSAAWSALSTLGSLTNLLRITLHECAALERANAEHLSVVLTHLDFQEESDFDGDLAKVAGSSLWLAPDFDYSAPEPIYARAASVDGADDDDDADSEIASEGAGGAQAAVCAMGDD